MRLLEIVHPRPKAHHVCHPFILLHFSFPFSTHLLNFPVADSSPAADSEHDVEAVRTTKGVHGPVGHMTSRSQSGVNKRSVEKEIRRMLLLNAYPILYIILWAPGMINRLVEASGHKSRVLTILQCSTQFIGLANAITYGFNEHLRKAVKGDLMNWFRR